MYFDRLALFFAMLVKGQVNTGLYNRTNVDSLTHIWLDETLADSSRLQAIDQLAKLNAYRRPDSAVYFADLQYSYAQAVNDDLNVAKALATKGVASSIQGKYEEALAKFEEGLVVEQKIGKEDRIANSFSNIGIVYAELGDIFKSVEHKSWGKCIISLKYS